MYNDVLMALSAKIERLYNKMIASETKKQSEYLIYENEIKSLRSQLEKTNNLLENIYNKLK